MGCRLVLEMGGGGMCSVGFWVSSWIRLDMFICGGLGYNFFLVSRWIS